MSRPESGDFFEPIPSKVYGESKARLERSATQIQEVIRICAQRSDSAALTTLLRVWRDEHPKHGASTPSIGIPFLGLILVYILWQFSGNKLGAFISITLFGAVCLYCAVRWRRVSELSREYSSPYSRQLEVAIQKQVAQTRDGLTSLDEEDRRLMERIIVSSGR
jgi:hypothetical protein